MDFYPPPLPQIFLDADNVDNARKIQFDMKFSLSCDAAWVQHPDHLDLMYVTRHFLVYVDPKGLEPGAHSAHIKAYDVKNVRSISTRHQSFVNIISRLRNAHP